MTVKQLVKGTVKDIGGFMVRRLLPDMQQKSLGPVVFMDHIGPAELGPGLRMDVRPHPHIHLATMTWLFEGTIMHKDSLGCIQEIRPGAVNWMTAGSGIVHSERSLESDTDKTVSLHGIQTWVALPVESQNITPSFEHYTGKEIPLFREGKLEITVIAGEFKGHKSPVKLYSPMIYLDIFADDAVTSTFSFGAFEVGFYVVSGELGYENKSYQSTAFVIPESAQSFELQFSPNTRVMVIGGEPFPEERHLWWNFVSSSKENIEVAKARWQVGDFPKVSGDDSFIPLPEK